MYVLQTKAIWRSCKTGIERENSTEIMFEIQTSDYLDWLANGVNHSHPDFGGPGCYTFRSSRQWVRQNNIYTVCPKTKLLT